MGNVELIIEPSKKKNKKKSKLPKDKQIIETNELDRNAMGGTELMKYGLYERLP